MLSRTDNQVNKLKRIINWTVWTLMGLYVLVLVGIEVPAVQRFLGNMVAGALKEKLGTTVSIGKINLGLLNRVIIDDILIYDQQKQEMVRANRLSAKVELTPLAQGKIAISSAQIFGVNASFYRNDSLSAPNFQFVLDSLASKDTTQHKPLDLRINSFIMRHSSISYDQRDVAPTPGRFNPSHLHVKNISAHIILKALTDDSLNVKVKRLAFSEQSGLNVQRTAFQLIANNSAASLHDFNLQLSESTLHADSLMATYQRDRLKETLQFNGVISNTTVTPSELRCFVPWLKNYQHCISLSTTFFGTPKSINIPQLSLASDKGDLALSAQGYYHQGHGRHPEWNAVVNQFYVSNETLDFIGKNAITLPDAVMRLGDIQMTGTLSGDSEGTLTADTDIWTDAGGVKSDVRWTENRVFAGHLKTDGIALGQLLDNDRLGTLAADLEVAGKFNGNKLVSLMASGSIPTLTFDGHDYQQISLDGQYADNHLNGWLTINDDRIRTRLEADVNATSLKDFTGTVSLSDLQLPEKDFHLSFLRLESGYEDNLHIVKMYSDMAHATLKGQFDFATLPQSTANIVGSKLPTLPGLPRLTNSVNNNFTLHLTVAETSWLEKLTGVSLQLNDPLDLTATINDGTRQLHVDAVVPNFVYNDVDYKDFNVSITTPNDTMFANVSLTKIDDLGLPMSLQLQANAANNNLTTALSWDNHKVEKQMKGRLDAVTHLYRNLRNEAEAHVTITPSPIYLGGELWHVEASDMVYNPKGLDINSFTVKNGDQHIIVNGRAGSEADDALTVDLNQMEVAYILDLVNFHAVDFTGKATGRAVIASVNNDPSMHADLTVDHFTFEAGRMGTLSANVDWNRQLKQVDIDAVANDGDDAQTIIRGYVSPERSHIDLAIGARGTHIDFLKSFTSSFLSNISGHAQGDVRLHGPLSTMQLTGQLVVDGQATVTPLGTTYTLRHDTVRLVPDDILLQDIPIYDRYNNVGLLSGGIHHEHLTNLTFDLAVHTDLLQGYDVKDFGENTFYGTVFAAGDVTIQGRPGRVTIDCDVTPLRGSLFTYNVASPDAISNQEFITWRSRGHDGTGEQENGSDKGHAPEPPSSRTDIYLNFNIYANPDATMRLLMDASTGDYITLNGSGVLRATYYNKGTFQMFGTYTVDHGTYGITIQNIIKKNFTFNPGGTIVFGGDPYDAALQLQAAYPVQGVSLSDLAIGNSFSQNTIRVNCLMNITGQPNQPRVDFDLDMPTVNTDEQQMVRSVINGEQEMNQQVLYLLTVGRFYQQGVNNEQSSQDQTSLAMQSLLSGTLSSQLNNVLSSVIKNDDWNFGANISTGTEGWNNAEYEGIVNGRMLNNRLLINGQFGYRDNAAQATQSFIGDFDIRYLLYPSGNLALKVYNQTNDRYFTRSSLNTQGIGLILKKDFGSLGELFRKR